MQREREKNIFDFLFKIVDWSTCLSTGEQQRLAFIRVFALFKYRPNETHNTLVMFDESTSAVDAKTESVIYELLNDFHIWFVTISHRPSLIRYHQKELKLYSKNLAQQERELDLTTTTTADPWIDISIKDNFPATETDEEVVGETQIANVVTSGNSAGYTELKRSKSVFREIIDIWKLIHLPFHPHDRIIRIEVKQKEERNLLPKNSMHFLFL